MTTLKLNLPDELAQRAQNADLLTDTAIQKLLEEAIRRDAGQRLLAVGKRLHAANIAPMSDEDVVAEASEHTQHDGSSGSQEHHINLTFL